MEMMTMADEYIRRSDALKGIELFQCGWAEIEAVQSDYIERLTAADVAPVRHGRWIKDEFFSDEVNNGEKCSQCGELIGWFGNLPKYCSGCGALMDGGNEGE
jgi:hypothetical protein